MKNEQMDLLGKKSYGWKAFFPLLVFLILYLGFGLFSISRGRQALSISYRERRL